MAVGVVGGGIAAPERLNRAQRKCLASKRKPNIIIKDGMSRAVDLSVTTTHPFMCQKP